MVELGSSLIDVPLLQLLCVFLAHEYFDFLGLVLRNFPLGSSRVVVFDCGLGHSWLRAHVEYHDIVDGGVLGLDYTVRFLTLIVHAIGETHELELDTSLSLS